MSNPPSDPAGEPIFVAEIAQRPRSYVLDKRSHAKALRSLRRWTLWSTLFALIAILGNLLGWFAMFYEYVARQQFALSAEGIYSHIRYAILGLLIAGAFWGVTRTLCTRRDVRTTGYVVWGILNLCLAWSALACTAATALIPSGVAAVQASAAKARARARMPGAAYQVKRRPGPPRPSHILFTPEDLSFQAPAANPATNKTDQGDAPEMVAGEALPAYVVAFYRFDSMNKGALPLFLNDGKQLAIATRDGAVLLNFPDFTPATRYRGGSSLLDTSLGLSSEGLLVGRPSFGLTIVDPVTFQAKSHLPIAGFKGLTSRLPSPWATVSENDRFSLINLKTRQRVLTIPDKPTFSLDPQDGRHPRPTIKPYSWAFTPDGMSLLAMDGDLHRFAIEKDRLTYVEHSNPISPLPRRPVFSQDGERILVMTRLKETETVLAIFDFTEFGEVPHIVQLDYPARAFTASGDLNTIYYINDEVGSLYIAEEKGRQHALVNPPFAQPGDRFHLLAHPDGKHLLVVYREYLLLLDLERALGRVP